MRVFTLDIETKPNPLLVDLFMSGIKAPGNYKDEDKIAAYIEEKKLDMVKQMSVDIDFCVLRCIGFKVANEPARIITLEELLEVMNNELKIKHQMATDFTQTHFFRLVTFNGKHFDLPIIIREAIRRGVKSPALRLLQQMTKRYDSNSHIDLMEVLGDGNFRSLDMYSKIYLNWPKKELDFLTCTDQELEEHCIDDVNMTAALYNKFEDCLK